MLLDRISDIFLLGLTVSVCACSQKARHIIIFMGSLGIALVAPLYTLYGAEGLQPDWAYLFRQAPLWLAVGGFGWFYIAGRDRFWKQPDAWPRAMLLAALAIRFGQIAIQYFADGLLETKAHESVLIDAKNVVDFIAFVSFFMATACLLLAAAIGRRGPQLLLVVAAIVSGGLLGATFPGSTPAASAVLFTLALVRPAAIIGSQMLLPQRVAKPFPLGVAVACVVAAVLSFTGLLLANGFWDMTPGRSALVSLAFALPAMPVAYLSRGGGKGITRIKGPPVGLLDTDRVTLPDGWDKGVATAYAAFLSLEPEVRIGIAHLKRWERLLLTIDAARHLDRRAYERTTPGLHLATHCPYSQIGPEINRANKRTNAIMADLDLLSSEGPLVTSWWGTADGLRSGRVKMYATTHNGALVAAAIRERLRLASGTHAHIVGVLAESFSLTRDD